MIPHSALQARVRQCSFPSTPRTNSNKLYTCFDMERCCSEGCCIDSPYRAYHTWYYWLLLLLFMLTLSGGRWLCKKRSRLRRARNRAPRRRRSRQRGLQELEDTVILDRLLVSFSGFLAGAAQNPPSYSSALLADQQASSKFCPLISYADPPPTYSSVYKATTEPNTAPAAVAAPTAVPAPAPDAIPAAVAVPAPGAVPTAAPEDDSEEEVQVHEPAPESRSEDARNGAEASRGRKRGNKGERGDDQQSDGAGSSKDDRALPRKEPSDHSHSDC